MQKEILEILHIGHLGIEITVQEIFSAGLECPVTLKNSYNDVICVLNILHSKGENR
jgi:hypothetical protein